MARKKQGNGSAANLGLGAKLETQLATSLTAATNLLEALVAELTTMSKHN